MGLIAIGFKEGDALLDAILTSGNEEIMIAGTFRRKATATIKRYRQLPRITPMIRLNIDPFPMSVSPIINEARAIVTIPVPRLISQDL